MRNLIKFIVIAVCGLPVFTGGPAAAQRFNIGTYNLRYANHGDSLHGNGWGQRLTVISKLIRFHDFDIFGTQEGLYPMLEGLRDSLPGYTYIGIGRDDGKQAGEHSAIFYKTDKFTLLDKGDFWLSTITDRPNKGWDAVLPRICTWGKFRENATGFVFYMYNLHMDHIGVQARAESAKLILAKIKAMPAGTPVILTGDFNVDQTSESYALINNSGVLRDCYELSPLKYAMNGTFNNFRTDGKTDSRIDHIFVTSQFAVQRYGILLDTYRTKNEDAMAATDTSRAARREAMMRQYTARTPSDHFPVMVEVTHATGTGKRSHGGATAVSGLTILPGQQALLPGDRHDLPSGNRHGLPPDRHVILITVDGFRPDFYLDSSWQAVHIRQLMMGGAHAMGVNTVFPSMTYPAHTTIVTGVQPAQHGVYFNNMFEPNGPTGKMYWNTDSSIKVPTIWSAAEKKGMKVAALFWPVSADAPVQYNIPDIGSMGETVRERYARPAGFVDEVKQHVFDGATRIEYGRDVNVGRIAAYVIGKDQPQLMTIHLFSVDHNEHQQGREGDQVREAVRGADSAVGIIMDAVKKAGIWDQTDIIVTGDHGFVTVKTSVNPNVWLVKAGLITDVRKDEWKAQFFSVGGSSYLFLKDPRDKATLDRVHHILDSLPEEQKKLFRIISRRQLDEIGGNPEAAFALSGLDGTSLGNGMTGEAVRPGHGGTHGYFPDFHEIQTGFVVYGPGVRKGGMVPVMNERDITSVVVRLLGLDLPTAAGKVPAGLLE